MNKRRPFAKKNITVSPADYQLLEFHRQAVPCCRIGDPRPGLAVITPGKRPGITGERNCTCSGLSESNCLHVKRLAAIRDSYCKNLALSTLSSV